MGRLLQSLARRYRKEGWKIFADRLEGCERIPPTWNGRKPDLLAVRGKKMIACSLETPESLSTENPVDKWLEIISNDVRLMLIVKDPDSLKRAKAIARSEGIDATVRLMKKSRKRGSKEEAQYIWKESKIDWVIVAVIVLVFMVFFLTFFPDMLAYFKLRDFYQPFDRERQAEYLKERQEKEKGMSEEEKQDRRRKDLERKKAYEEHLKKIRGN